MKRNHMRLCAALFAAALALAGCARSAVENPAEPATVTAISADLNRIVLSDLAYQNLGIKTQPVREETSPPPAATASGTTAPTGTATASRRRLIVPTSAIIFTSQGLPFAYTSPAPKTYVRAPIVISGYRGTDVLLTSGPAVGTQVVTVGDPELLGIEYGVGGE